MDPRKGAAWDIAHQFAGQFEGVIPHSGAIDGHQHAVDVADVEVVAHQQHRPGGELEDVLAGAIAQDRLQPAHAPGAHHDQIAIELIGHLEHGLLGVALANDRVHVAGVEPEPLHGFGHDAGSLLGVFGEAFAGLLGHHVQQVETGLAHGGDVAQHANHLFDMAFAGVGN